MIRTYKRLKSITKITGFSLIGKKKMLTSAEIDYFQGFFFLHKVDDNKLLYKCAKFQVNSFCGLDFSLGVNLPPPPCFNATSEPPCTIGLIVCLGLIFFILFLLFYFSFISPFSGGISDKSSLSAFCLLNFALSAIVSPGCHLLILHLFSSIYYT